MRAPRSAGGAFRHERKRAGAAGPSGPRPEAAAHSLAHVYDHDPEDVAALGWEEFIARQWESIFAGYRSKTGLRKVGRRWSDLLAAGLGCSQDVADLLEVPGTPDDSAGLLEAHTRLLTFVRGYALGLDAG